MLTVAIVSLLGDIILRSLQKEGTIRQPSRSHTVSIKITNFQLANSMEPLAELLKKSIPVKTAFRLNVNRKKLAPLVETYEEARKKIIDEHVLKDKDGKFIPAVHPETKEELKGHFATDEQYHKLLTELLNIENEVDITLIKIDDLGPIELKTTDLAILDWLITE
jgi:hypothetical protein